MNTDGVTIAGGPSVTKSGIDAAGNKVTKLPMAISIQIRKMRSTEASWQIMHKAWQMR
ncbi:hypothetical protein ACINWC323_0624 [Acinetobacter sp. WC-323]|nr:hypothetical protein ACINWC323_0624 [Acinetobacter sp. WC-323]